jgi:hypothetical protein
MGDSSDTIVEFPEMPTQADSAYFSSYVKSPKHSSNLLDERFGVMALMEKTMSSLAQI